MPTLRFARYLATFLWFASLTVYVTSATAVDGAILPANAPILMVLEHLENGTPKQTKVEAKAGQVASPIRGKSIEKIRVHPGNPLATAQQPNDVTVEFYRGAGAERALLCAIGVRYFRDRRRVWVPHFQLIEDVLVARGPDGRWQPLTIGRGIPSLIVLTTNTLPNPEGFYPTLEFGLTNGLVQIDSWVVR